jgi:hypothetical protein
MQRDPRAFLWDVTQNALPLLIEAVQTLLNELGDT